MQMINVVLDEDTSKLMEMIHIMKNPKCRELWGKLYGNKLGCLAQGIPGRVEGTDTIFFIDKQYIPTARWLDVTCGRVI